MTDESVPTELCPTHHIPVDGPCLICELAPHHRLPLSVDEAEVVYAARLSIKRAEKDIADVLDTIRQRYPKPPPVGPTASELASRSGNAYPLLADLSREQVMT